MATHASWPVLCTALLAFPIQTQQTAATTIDGAFLTQALGFSVSNVQALPAPTTAAKSRASEFTGVEVSTLGTARLMRADFSSDRPPASGTLFVCVVYDPQLELDIVIGVDDDGIVRGAAVAADGEVDVQWRRFCAQIRGRAAPRTDNATSFAEFQQRLATAAEAKTPEAKLTIALFKQRAKMMSILDPFMTAVERWQREGTVGTEIEAAIRHFDEYAEGGESLQPILGNKHLEYEGLAKQAASELREFRDAIKSEEDPQSIIARSRSTCTACHRLEVEDRKGQWQDVAKELRTERGVGDGFYAVGHDLFRAGMEADKAQPIATALRCAALLIELREDG